MKIVSRVLIVLLLLQGYVQCSEDLPDCPSKMCVIAGTWQLKSVFFDNEKDGSDYSNYRLALHYPDPAGSLTSEFDRIQPSGTEDNGSWSIENDGSILRLVPGGISDLTEDWIIERYSPRELVLVIHRDGGVKEGPSVIRLLLEPI